MKKTRILSLILILTLLFACLAPSALAVDEPSVDCYAAYLVKLDEDGSATTLYAKNIDDLVYPASLTKVMTALITIEAIEDGKASLSDMVMAQSGYDFDLIEGGTTAWIYAEEKLSLQDLLYCALVESANDACNVIAAYIGGSIAGFVSMMNERAQELGCVNTKFANCHGLPNSNHYTTAADYMLVLEEAVQHSLFMEICNTVNYTTGETSVSAPRSLSSTNSLINPDNPMYPETNYVYPYAKGIKTGHTSDAGYCLASSAEKDGVTLISLVFNGQRVENADGTVTYQHFNDTVNLFEWAFNNYSERELLKASEIVDNIPVELGSDGNTVAIRPSTSITAYVPNDLNVDELERTITLYSENGGEALEAPVEAGQPVGTITLSKDGVEYGSATLITNNSVDLSRVDYMKGAVGDTLRRPVVILIFLILCLVLAFYVLMVLRYRAKRKAYQKRIESAKKLHQLDEECDGDTHVVQTVRTAPRTTGLHQKNAEISPDDFADEEEDEPAIESTQISRAPITDEEEDDEMQKYFNEFFEKK